MTELKQKLPIVNTMTEQINKLPTESFNHCYNCDRPGLYLFNGICRRCLGHKVWFGWLPGKHKNECWKNEELSE